MRRFHINTTLFFSLLLSGCYTVQPLQPTAKPSIETSHLTLRNQGVYYAGHNLIDIQNNMKLYMDFVVYTNEKKYLLLVAHLHGLYVDDFLDESLLRYQILTQQNKTVIINLKSMKFQYGTPFDTFNLRRQYKGPACIYALNIEQFEELANAKKVTYIIETGLRERSGEIPQEVLANYRELLKRIK